MLDNIRKILYNISVNKERGNTPKELKMIRLKKSQTEPHKANAIDKRAIHNLISHLQWEIKRDGLNITTDWLTDESYYRIIKIDGYENIIFQYPFDNELFLETVQPIDRANNKLFPIQAIEIQICYKRY